MQPPYEVMSTPWLSHDELEVLHKIEDAVDRLYNSGRFRRTLAYVLAAAGISPFALFLRFGEYAAAAASLDRLSLDDYTALAFAFFSAQHGVDRAVLRDRMVCDRLAANAAGKLPSALRVEDAALKSAIRALEQSGPEKRRRKGVRRGYALLYTEQCLVYADYDICDPVTGEYPLKKYSV